MTETQAAAVVTAEAGGAPERAVVRLDDPVATDPALTGAKAAALARAAAEGLPALPGFVLTTAAAWLDGLDRDSTELDRWLGQAAREHWEEFSSQGEQPLIVRSSSTVEDGAHSSMAGMFTSVPGVRSWGGFVEAVGIVLDSRKSVPGIEAAPMAVLVQPLLDPELGGVLFGSDPVTGRSDRLVVAATEGSPEQLVSGEVDGAQYLLSRTGRPIEAERPLPSMTRRKLRQLADLAAGAAEVFGSPQDVEWAFSDGGSLHLLQSRPITAVSIMAKGMGPVLGPGPVAETFPDPLTALEEDLWVTPLRTALGEALRLTGAASSRRLSASPVVTTVQGRAAADLELMGEKLGRRSFVRMLDPRPPARRLRASWNVGRLRAALPSLAGDLIGDVDKQLLAIAPMREHTDEQLVDLLKRSHQALVALHGHEILAGLLVAPGAPATTAASAALRILAEARESGIDEDEIAVRHPVVLSLVPPRVGPAPALPPVPAGAIPSGARGEEAGLEPDDPALLREALRLRARWVQELTARVAWELGSRLTAKGLIADVDLIRHCRMDDLPELLAGNFPEVLAERREQWAASTSTDPLPAAFRLSETGEVVEVRADAAEAGAATVGRPAGGGQVTGIVHNCPGTPVAGAVLVVRSLDPGLAPVLPHLGGLVAETGSTLSHLAVLAREFGVPTVVGVRDALRRFPHGAEVLVNGITGEASALSEPEAESDAGHSPCPEPAPAFAAGLT